MTSSPIKYISVRRTLSLAISLSIKNRGGTVWIPPPFAFLFRPNLVSDCQVADRSAGGRVGADHQALIRVVVNRAAGVRKRIGVDCVLRRSSATAGPDEVITALLTSRQNGVDQVGRRRSRVAAGAHCSDRSGIELIVRVIQDRGRVQRTKRSDRGGLVCRDFRAQQVWDGDGRDNQDDRHD